MRAVQRGSMKGVRRSINPWLGASATYGAGLEAERLAVLFFPLSFPWDWMEGTRVEHALASKLRSVVRGWGR